jgi:hypothetical protein
VIPECRDDESTAAADEPVAAADPDIACEIDKLDYLQVIPECRDDEPTAAAATPGGDAQIREVSSFRMFKGNLPQWRVRWTADDTESWETFEKLDSEPVRAQALELRARSVLPLPISPVVTQAKVPAEMAKTAGGDTDIACEIDKLEYLQVIPECRDDEPVAADEPIAAADPDIACEIDKLEYLQVIPECRDDEPVAAAAMPTVGAQISAVSGFRMFKGNLAQWRVRWSADDTESWERFDTLDSEPLRARALELQAAAK